MDSFYRYSKKFGDKIMSLEKFYLEGKKIYRVNSLLAERILRDSSARPPANFADIVIFELPEDFKNARDVALRVLPAAKVEGGIIVASRWLLEIIESVSTLLPDHKITKRPRGYITIKIA